MNTLRSEIYTNTHEVQRRYDFLRATQVTLGALAVEKSAEGFTKEMKLDDSPVTSIDILLNQRFIEMVEDEFPHDKVWGEEATNSERGNLDEAEHNWVWIVDPIDGTKKLVNAYATNTLGQCNATVLAAAFAPGETTPTISGVYSPFHRKKLLISANPEGVELWTPQAGGSRQIVLGEGPATLSDVDRYEYSSWGSSLKQLDEIMPFARRFRTQTRMASVALGDVDVSVFPAPSHPHDVLPGAHIVHKAGGQIRSLSGKKYEDIDWRVDPLGGVIAAVSPELADTLVEQLAL